jgi:hypothetical protein
MTSFHRIFFLVLDSFFSAPCRLRQQAWYQSSHRVANNRAATRVLGSADGFHRGVATHPAMRFRDVMMPVQIPANDGIV